MFALNAEGQGTLNFATKVTGAVDARVLVPLPAWAGGFVGAGSEFVGQLYAGPPGSPLAAVGVPVPFRNDVGIGYITAGGQVTVPGVPGGSPASVELRAWKVGLGVTYEAALGAAGGQWVGRSAPIIVVLAGPGPPFRPDPNLVGLQGFLIILPEPSAALLGLLGWSVFVCSGRRS